MVTKLTCLHDITGKLNKKHYFYKSLFRNIMILSQVRCVFKILNVRLGF